MSPEPHPARDRALQAVWLALMAPATALYFALDFRTFVKVSSLVTLLLSLVALAEARAAKKEAARGREDAIG